MAALLFSNRIGACAGLTFSYVNYSGGVCAEFRAPIAFTSEFKRWAPSRILPIIYGKARLASVQLT